MALIDREYAKDAVKYIPWCDWKAVGECLDACPAIDPESLRPKWISVEDMLPEESGYYFVARNSGYLDVLSYSAKHKAFNAGDDEIEAKYSITVTHWMPLPEPPKGE